MLVDRVSDVPKPLEHTIARCTECNAICWVSIQLVKEMPPKSVLAPTCWDCVTTGRVAIKLVAHGSRGVGRR